VEKIMAFRFPQQLLPAVDHFSSVSAEVSISNTQSNYPVLSHT
jgi:hypothetical protein